MTDWRDIILKEFPAQVAKLTLVADPDGLLIEEGILRGLREQGFELIPFKDPIEFRYAYESRYRGEWDRGRTTNLVVVLRSQARDLETLPYDLYHAGRRVTFDLTAVFPNLSYPVVDALNRRNFEALYEAQQQYNPGRLGDNQTKDFILLHVFELEPKLIRQPAQLLHALIRLHYQKIDLPVLLAERFVQVLRQGGQFEDWPLEQLVSDRIAFFEFLQERWKHFIRHGVQGRESATRDGHAKYGLRHPGPLLLPFEHHDVRVYLDNLFAEGLLEYVGMPEGSGVAGTWAAVGMSLGGSHDQLRRFERLLTEVEESIPSDAAPHQEWVAFAQRWAELQVVQYRLQEVPPEAVARLQAIDGKKAAGFSAWMANRYGSLYNQPPDPPVMVHHIPHVLATRIMEKTVPRVAFVLVDGLSMGQWCVVRNVLRKSHAHLRFDEQAVFAWVPTLTCVSRQAAFSGKIPYFFPDTITTTSKDGAGWKQFWLRHGLVPAQIDFVGPVEELADPTVQAALAGQIKALGIVVGTVDNIMHGMQLGMAGMHNQVEQWAGQGKLGALLSSLVSRGWDVFLGADHGNVEARGCGSPSEGVLVETKGQRVRVYDSETFRAKTACQVDSIVWPPTGLPEGYFPLMAPAHKAFSVPGATIVAHGGISLEEVVVPWIHVHQ